MTAILSNKLIYTIIIATTSNMIINMERTVIVASNNMKIMVIVLQVLFKIWWILRRVNSLKAILQKMIIKVLNKILIDEIISIIKIKSKYNYFKYLSPIAPASCKISKKIIICKAIGWPLKAVCRIIANKHP